jgi:hypothetical protein
MTPSDRWRRVQDLFEQLETVDAPGHAEYLARVEPDAELRDETLRLWESARLEEEANRRLKPPSPAAPAIPPEQIDGITFQAVLGSGGFGTVYSAERRVNDVAQRAAVKLFHAHRLGPDARRRFQREQRVLAKLDHPGIVRFLDAGLTNAGQPYLVMEQVDGAPIHTHCDSRRLSLEARLRLAADACAAIQYAHRHLVVHLDLKPSNMLVTAEGQVKLLDFGTAKLLDDTGAPTVTQQLTPLYACPERLRGEAGSVGSDVYSLGLVIFELISGGWPFRDRESLAAIAARASGFQEPRPLAAACTPEAAAAQGVTVERLRKDLSGDLEAICSKALAHSPSERYGSMGELQEDIRRYLANEPVLAHPPGALYRARKFVRRNRRALAATAAASLLLLASAAYAWREKSQGDRRFQEARGMARYVLFDLYDRVNELPGSTAVRAHMAGIAQTELDRLAILARADAGLRLESAAGYNRLAEIQGVSGSSSLGNTETATGNLARARGLLDALLAEQPGHREALIERARNSLLGAKLQNWNRRSTAEARPHIEQAARDLVQAKDTANPNWLRTRASLAVQRADLAEFENDFVSEASIAGLALAEMERWPAHLLAGADGLLKRVALLKRLGNAAYEQKKFQDALASYQSAHNLLRDFDSRNPNRPEILYALMDMSYQMAYCFGELKQPQRMIDSTRESIEIGGKLIGFDHENRALARSYWNKRQALAEGLALMGDHAGAVREQEAVLEARLAARKAQPDSNLAAEDVLVTEATLAGILAGAGNQARACALATECLSKSRALHASEGMTPKNWTAQQRMLERALAGCAGR